MGRLRDSATDDLGMTIAELLVGLSLMVIVFGGAWGIAFTVNRGQRQAEAEALRAQAVTYPLTRTSELVLQNIRIETNPAPTGYMLAIRTDQNMDDQQELHFFDLATDGLGESYIRHRSNLLTIDGDPIWPARFTERLGRYVTNYSAGVPLFRYYDEGGAEVLDPLQIPARARTVVITIRSTVDNKTLTESTKVVFRNRE